MGDEDGIFRSAASRLAARGVACGFDGLLGGSRAEDAGDAVEFLEERPLRGAGEDIANVRNWGVDGGSMSMGVEVGRMEGRTKASSRVTVRRASRVKWFPVWAHAFRPGHVSLSQTGSSHKNCAAIATITPANQRAFPIWHVYPCGDRLSNYICFGPRSSCSPAFCLDANLGRNIVLSPRHRP